MTTSFQYRTNALPDILLDAAIAAETSTRHAEQLEADVTRERLIRVTTRQLLRLAKQSHTHTTRVIRDALAVINAEGSFAPMSDQVPPRLPEQLRLPLADNVQCPRCHNVHNIEHDPETDLYACPSCAATWRLPHSDPRK